MASPLQTNDASGDRLEVELRVAEYKSVREEWLTSRDAQQHTLQWTLAALAVLLAGILTSEARHDQPFIYITMAGVVAAIAISSQAIWFGELMRMERASLFLRGLEMAYRDLGTDNSWPPPLIWDSWRAFRGDHEDSPMIYSAAPLVLACFAIYALLTAGALAILCAAALDHQIPSDDRALALGIAVVVGSAYVVGTLYLGLKARSIWQTFDKPARFDHLTSPTGTPAKEGAEAAVDG